jgi:hypothetical protein
MPDRVKVVELIRGQSEKLRSKLRKVVTGDEKKRVRDHVQEQPDYVKLIDKVAFTLGLLNILACEYFLIEVPTYFWLWYSLVIPILLLVRFFHFNHLGYQYFLLDFCYFVLFCTFVNLFYFWDSQLCFKVCFIYTNGPLTMAIVIWRCSLVFHDYDKITSVYIHFLPSMLYYAARWYGHQSGLRIQDIFLLDIKDLGLGLKYSPMPTIPYDNLVWKDFGVAAFGYVIWQLIYFIKTEVLDKSKLDARPDLLTSLRWMSSDKKNFFAIIILKLCRLLGLLLKDEEFDASSTKTKVIFISAQFLYSLLTFFPATFLYNSQYIHTAYLSVIFIIFTFNGASFYIEVFSKVYQQKIDRLRENRKISFDHKYAVESVYQGKFNDSLDSQENTDHTD